MVVMPVGTVKVCSWPVKEKAHVVVPSVLAVIVPLPHAAPAAVASATGMMLMARRVPTRTLLPTRPKRMPTCVFRAAAIVSRPGSLQSRRL
jgi:hypothetical protein